MIDTLGTVVVCFVEVLIIIVCTCWSLIVIARTMDRLARIVRGEGEG